MSGGASAVRAYAADDDDDDDDVAVHAHAHAHEHVDVDDDDDDDEHDAGDVLMLHGAQQLPQLPHSQSASSAALRAAASALAARVRRLQQPQPRYGVFATLPASTATSSRSSTRSLSRSTDGDEASSAYNAVDDGVLVLAPALVQPSAVATALQQQHQQHHHHAAAAHHQHASVPAVSLTAAAAAAAADSDSDGAGGVRSSIASAYSAFARARASLDGGATLASTAGAAEAAAAAAAAAAAESDAAGALASGASTAAAEGRGRGSVAAAGAAAAAAADSDGDDTLHAVAAQPATSPAVALPADSRTAAQHHAHSRLAMSSLGVPLQPSAASSVTSIPSAVRAPVRAVSPEPAALVGAGDALPATRLAQWRQRSRERSVRIEARKVLTESTVDVARAMGLDGNEELRKRVQAHVLLAQRAAAALSARRRLLTRDSNVRDWREERRAEELRSVALETFDVEIHRTIMSLQDQLSAIRRALRSATRKALRRVDELWMRHVEAANVLVTVDTAARVRSEYHELHRRELTMLTEDILGGPSPVTLAARNVLASIRYTKQMLLDRFDDEADVLRAAALKQAAEAARVKAEDRVLLRECSHDVDALFTRRQLQEARVAAARFVRIFMLRREQLAQQEARRALELRVPVARAALDQRFEQRQLAVEREERAKELERHRAQAIAVMRAGSPASGARHASSPSPTGTDASPSAGAGGAAQAVSPRSVKFADDVAEPAPGAVAVAGVGASPRAAPRTASPAGAGQRARTPTTLPTHAHGDGDADGTLVVSDGVVESRVNPLRGKQRSATVVVERSAGRELPPLAGSARAARAPTGASTSASASAASGDAGTGASGGAGAGAAAPRDSVSGEVATAAPASLVPGVDEDELRASLAALSVPSLSEPMSLDLPATPRDASAVGAAALADPRDEQQAASAAVAPALVSPATAAIAGRRASRDSAGDGAFSADAVAAMPRRAPAATVYVRRSRDSDTDGDVTATGRRAPASSVYIPASTSALTVAAFAASAVTAGEDVVVLSPGEADQVRQMLDEGALFVKHGRAGRPHKRFVWVPPPYNAVYWGVTRKANARESLMVREIERVVAGQTTAVFKRRSGDDNREDYSFSLVAGERTLDLEADTPARRDVFVRAFRVLLMPGVFKGE